MIRYTKLYDGASDLTQAHEGDAGWDIRAASNIWIYPGVTTKVPTGIALEIPEGYAVLVLPRSGLASKEGITIVNSPGLIDSGYRGEVFVMLNKLDAGNPYFVQQGERIAQLLLHNVGTTSNQFSQIPLYEFDTETERGVGGLGSSGRL